MPLLWLFCKMISCSLREFSVLDIFPNFRFKIFLLSRVCFMPESVLSMEFPLARGSSTSNACFRPLSCTFWMCRLGRAGFYSSVPTLEVSSVFMLILTTSSYNFWARSLDGLLREDWEYSLVLGFLCCFFTVSRWSSYFMPCAEILEVSLRKLDGEPPCLLRELSLSSLSPRSL